MVVLSSNAYDLPWKKAQQPYYSQFGQDCFVNEKFFHNKKGGFFVDIGASDGKGNSNTLFFEKSLKWEGVCIEPRLDTFGFLKKNRKCTCLNIALGEKCEKRAFFDGGPWSGFVDSFSINHLRGIFRLFKEKQPLLIDSRNRIRFKIYDIQCLNFNDVISRYGKNRIDFLSLDVEGCELEILKTIDFDKFDIRVLTVEDWNDEGLITQYLQEKGYAFVKRLNLDNIYLKEN